MSSASGPGDPGDAEGPTLGAWFGPWAAPDDDPELGWGPPDPRLLVVEHEPPTSGSAYLEGWRYTLPTLAVGVVIALLAALGGSPVRADPGRVGSSYLADAGVRTIMAAPDDAGVVTRETGRVTGAAVYTSGPAGLEAARRYGSAEFEKQLFFADESRLLLRHREDIGRLVTTLGLNRSGAVTLAESTPETWTLYSPGLPTLPHRLAAGQRWEAVGTALSGTAAEDLDPAAPPPRSRGYHFTAAADPAPGWPDCLRVSYDLELAGETSRHDEQTRCPGRGVVAETIGSTRFDAVEAYPPGYDPSRLLVFSRDPAWRTPDAWTAREPRVAQSSLRLSALRVAGTASNAGDVMVDPGSSTLFGLRREGDVLRVRWSAYPGRDVINAWMYGWMVVVATSERRLVAYDNSTGEWLWTLDQTETTTTAPALVGERLVVVNQDGEITGVDARTGRPAWRRALRTDVRVAPRACGDAVVLASEAPQLLALDAGTGETRWQRDLDLSVDELVCAGQTVVTVDDGAVAAADQGDGQERWRRGLPFAARQVAVAGDTVALANPRGGLFGLHLADGTNDWSQPEATRAVVSDGGRFLAVGESQASLVDAAGRRLARWPLSWEPDSSEVSVAASPEGVWLGDGSRVAWIGQR